MREYLVDWYRGEFYDCCTVYAKNERDAMEQAIGEIIENRPYPLCDVYGITATETQ